MFVFSAFLWVSKKPSAGNGDDNIIEHICNIILIYNEQYYNVGMKYL